MGRRHVSVVAALAGATLLWLFIIPAAGARVDKDPCGQDPLPHVTHVGSLHCGAIFAIPGHRTEWTPDTALPPPCERNVDAIPGFGPDRNLWPLLVVGARWNYWTSEAKWVLWDGGHELGSWHEQYTDKHWVDQIRPRFHNWWHETWAVRVYFHCGQPLSKIRP